LEGCGQSKSHKNDWTPQTKNRSCGSLDNAGFVESQLAEVAAKPAEARPAGVKAEKILRPL